MKIKLIYLPIFCLLQIVLFGQNEPATSFAEANDLYQQKKYAAAAKIYEDVLKNDWQSVDLHYNLANAYYKNKELGKAILHYERALLLAPGNEDVQYNLAIAENERRDEIEVLPPFFLAAWWQNMRSAASSTTWGVIGILLFWIGIGGFLFLLLGKSRKHKKMGFIGGVVALLLSILPLSLAYSRAMMEKNSGTAVVLAEEINLKSGPDESSTTLNKLHEGTKVALVDVIGAWHQVKLPNGEIGWLEKSGLEEI